MSYAGKIRAGMAYIEITTENSKLARGLSQAQTSLKNFGVAIQAVGGDMLRMAAMTAVPFGLAIKTFADFDDEMRTLQAISEASDEQLEALTAQAKMLGATTAFTAQQVAQGMVSLSRLGFSADQVAASIQPVLNLVRATGSQMFRLGDIAEITASIMRNFKLAAEETSDVCDVLTAAANRSAVDIFDLGESIKIIGPSAYPVGDSIRDVAANLMTLANAGIRGSLAGTALRKAYQSLAQQTSAEATQLRELGIALEDVNGNLRRPMDILRDLSVVVAKMKSGEKINFTVDVFDLRGSLGALPLLAAANETKKFRKELDNVAGLADITAAKMEKGLGGALRALISRLESVKLAIGEAFDTSFRGMIVSIVTWLDNVRKWINTNQQFVAQLVMVSGAVAACGATLVALGITFKLAATAVGVLGGAFKVLATAILLPVNAVIFLHNAINAVLLIFPLVATAVSVVGSAFTAISISVKMFTASAFFSNTAILMLSTSVAVFRAALLAAIGTTIAMISMMHGIVAVSSVIIGGLKTLSGAVLTLGMVFRGVQASIMAMTTAIRVAHAIIAGLGVAIQLLRSIVITFNTTAIAGKAAVVGFAAILTTARGVAVGVQITFAGITFTMKVLTASALAASVAIKVVVSAFIAMATVARVARGAMSAVNAAIITVSGVFSAIKTAITGFAVTLAIGKAAIISFVASGAAIQAVFSGITGAIAIVQGVVAGIIAAFTLLRGAVITFNATAIAGKAAIVGLGVVMATARGVAIALQASFAGFTITMKALTSSMLAANVAVRVVSMTITAAVAIINAFRVVVSATSLITMAWAAVLKTISVVVGVVTTVFKAVQGAILGFNIAAAAATGITSLFNAVLVIGKAAVSGFTAVLGLLKAVFVAVGVAATTGWAAVLGPVLAIGTIITVAVVAIHALSGAFTILGNAMKAIGNGFVTAFGNIKQVASEAFSIVNGALLAGDMAGAAKVGLAALYVIWLEGIQPLKKAWLELKNFLCDSWSIVKSWILKAANGLWYGLLYGLKAVGNSISDTWDKVWNGIISAFESTIAWLKKKWIQFKGFFDNDVDVDAEIAKVDQEIAENRTERARSTNAKISGRQAELDAINNELAASNKAIDEQTAADISANQKAYHDAMRQSTQDLKDAHARYEEAKKFAALWRPMQEAVSKARATFDEAVSNYKQNDRSSDHAANAQKRQLSKNLEVARQDKDGQRNVALEYEAALKKAQADGVIDEHEEAELDKIRKKSPTFVAEEAIRQAIETEKEKARVAKEEFEKALKEAQKDRVIDDNEKANLNRLSAEYGRATSLQQEFASMLDEVSVGTAEVLNKSDRKVYGSFSAENLNAMLGNSSPQERTAKAAEESVRQQKETNRRLKKMNSSGALTYTN